MLFQTKIKTLLSSLLLVLLSSNSLYAGVCGKSGMVNGLDIKVACLNIAGKLYSTNLINDPPGEYSWYWDESLNELSCSDDENNCAQASATLDLSFPSFEIANQLYRLELSYANDLEPYAWNYKSHVAINTTDTSGNTSNSVLSDTSLSEIKQAITDAVTQNQIPGAVLAVSVGSETVILEAFGVSNSTTGNSMSTDNLLHIGSTNKAITSFLIAKLVDEGALQWDTKAQDIYSGFTLSNMEYAGQITIRQLLDMTSGLPKDSDAELSQARTLLEGLSDVTLIGSPGEQYEYSNLSVSIAAYLAVLAKNKLDNGTITDTDLDNLHANYESLLAEKILKPIGMTNSYLYVDQARQTGKMSSSHHLVNGSFVVSESVDKQVDVIAPAGGLKSTAMDMLNYVITEMQQGLAANGTQVVSSANTTERQKLSSGSAAANDYGLCLEVKTFSNGLTSIGHSGSFDNFNSLIGFFPSKKVAFVLLTNGDSPGALELTSGGIDGKIAELLGQ